MMTESLDQAFGANIKSSDDIKEHNQEYYCK